MDTGAILLQDRIAITPEDTAGTLSPRLAELGGPLLIETITQLKADTLVPRQQDHSQATLAPLLKKEDGLIDWTLGATAIANRVRGLSPWPSVYTFAGEDRWTIWRTVAATGQPKVSPGTVTQVTKDAIHVATGNGVLMLMELQPANSRRMTVAQYLAGNPVKVGYRLRGVSQS